MRNIFRLLWVCLWLCLPASLSYANEKIDNFNVVIVALENGDFEITEVITVTSQGRRIKHGIYRDLPRFYLEGDLEVPYRYTDISVTRNHRKEKFRRTTDGNAVRLIIGDEDTVLLYGWHTYTIKYRVKDQIKRGDTYDEIYWNVTGNDWGFSIHQSSVTVKAPDGAYLRYQKAYTGRHGDTGEDAIFRQEDGAYIYETSRLLEPRKGLTVVMRFNKGTFAATPEGTKRFIWWARNGAMLILSVTFMFMLQYYLRHWRRVGRDPVKDPVFARYKPPTDYSAAAVSYIHYNGVSGNKALIATLMGLAAKKWIDIETGKKVTTIRPLGEKLSAPLNAEEQFLYKRLFPKANSAAITLKKNAPHAVFAKSITKLSQRLRKNFGESYFRWNIKYILIGLLISIIALIAAVFQYRAGSFPGFGWGVLALVLLNVLFVILMPAPTELGQEKRSEIKGFRLYLKTAEKGRLNAVDIGAAAPPPMSAKHYEAMLPYAIALGVEEPWTEYFEKAVPMEAENYAPVWNNTSGAHVTSLSKSMGSAMSHINSGVSSAAPQSSGSSSSSGGFSGGGGGGGGGGGW